MQNTAVMGSEEHLTTLLSTNGREDIPPHGKHISLVRRTSNTVFPTISNAAPCIEAVSEAKALPPAFRGAGVFGWLYSKGPRVGHLAQSLIRTQCPLPITGALSGFCRVLSGALPKGAHKILPITCD